MPASRGRGLPALLLAVMLVAALMSGCGDGEKTAVSPDAKPELTLPRERISAAKDTPDEPTGATGGDSQTTQQPSTEQTTPPPADSTTGGQQTDGNGGTPAQNSYEQFCRENPGACGE